MWPGAQIVGEPDNAVKHVLDEFGVYMKSSSFSADVKVLLKEACTQVFGTATGLVDMLVAHIPSSKAGSTTKVQRSHPRTCPFFFNPMGIMSMDRLSCLVHFGI